MIKNREQKAQILETCGLAIFSTIRDFGYLLDNNSDYLRGLRSDTLINFITELFNNEPISNIEDNIKNVEIITYMGEKLLTNKVPEQLDNEIYKIRFEYEMGVLKELLEELKLMRN